MRTVQLGKPHPVCLLVYRLFLPYQPIASVQLYNARMIARITGVFAVAALSGIASASVVNGTFETPAFANGGFGDSLPGWTKSGEAGHWNIFPGYGFFNAEAPQGTQILYCNGSSVAQQTLATLQPGGTSLSVIAARRGDSFAGSFRMELWAAGTVASGSVVGGTLLSSVNFNHTLINPSSFIPLSLVYNATSNDPNLGSFISVRFVRLSGQMNFDNVQLNAVAGPGQNLTGTLVLGDSSSVFAFNRSIAYSVKQGTATVASGTTMASATSMPLSISIPPTVTGASQLVLDGSSFLKRVINVNLTGSNQVVGSVTMQNGDVDNSGEVDAADIDEVIADFGDTTNNPSDVDVSGEVDAADIDIVIANFGGVDQ